MPFKPCCLFLALLVCHAAFDSVTSQSVNGTSDLIRDKYAAAVKALNASLSDTLAAKVPNDLLVRSLMARNGSLEDAATLLSNYETVKSKNVRLFTVSRRNLFTRVQHAVGFVNGTKTKDGEFVFYHGVSSWDPSLMSLAEEDSCILVMHELLSLDHEINERGYVIVVDTKDVGPRHGRKMSARLQAAFWSSLLESLPVHITRVLIINSPPPATFFFNLMSPYLPERVATTLKFVTEEDMKVVFGEETVRNKAYMPTGADRISMAKRMIASLDDLMATRERVMI